MNNKLFSNLTKASTKNNNSFIFIFWALSYALTLGFTHFAALAFVAILTLIIPYIAIFLLIPL